MAIVGMLLLHLEVEDVPSNCLPAATHQAPDTGVLARLNKPVNVNNSIFKSLAV